MARLNDATDGQLVKAYIELRDRRAQRKAAYENEDADDKAKQEKIELELLGRFQAREADSVRTPFGTAYKSPKTSVTVADWESFFTHWVVPNNAWEFIERRCSKDAVLSFKGEHGELPPGLNYNEVITVGIRRS